MRLLIRCAVYEKDCEYDVEDQLTVQHLKEHLMLNHPGAPKSGVQRIIYMGRILSDDEVLRAVVDKYGESVEPYVMHLMYTLPPAELRQRKKIMAPTTALIKSTMPSASTTIPAPIDYQQMNAAYMQYIQQYQQAWMAQYSAYCQAMSGQSVPQMTHLTTPAIPEQVVNAPVADQAPQIDAALPENNAAPAQAEEDFMARDILDHVYMALRGSILLILLYYYSSTYRVLAVAFLGFIFWFMQRNRLDAAADAVAINVVNPQDEQRQQADEDNNNVPTTAEIITPPDDASALQVFLRTSHAFIGGFFLSLLPGGDHLLDQAEPAAPGEQANQQLPVM